MENVRSIITEKYFSKNRCIDNSFLIYFGCFYKTNAKVEGRANRENDSVVSSTHTAPLLYLNLPIGL